MNLDRLKGTPHLIDGFESFLRSWLAPIEPRQEPLPWTDEEMELVRAMPDCALQFYEAVQRWPSSWIVETDENEQDALFFPPRRVVEKWIRGTWETVTIDFARVEIAGENQGNWLVEVSLEESDFGKLYTNCTRDMIGAETAEGFPMEVPLDEFLVTFGFYNMIICSGPPVKETERFPDSELIFLGRYNADAEYGIFYHPDGFLWLGGGATKEDGHWWCAKRPG